MTETDTSILAKTARGAGWVVAWRMMTRTLGLLSTLILVRLLAPTDFGLVALGSSFSVAIEALSWIGLEEGVIRHKHPTPALYDTAFTLAVLRGALIGAIIAAAAYPGALFFAEPRLVQVIAALGFTAFLEGLINVGTVEFRRDFSFQKEFRLWLLPRILSIVIAVSLAAAFRTYWALIAGIVSNQALRVVLSYTMHPYRPRLRLAEWRELAGYSAWNSAVAWLGVMRSRVDTILIGRSMGTGDVGYYAVGYEIAELPMSELIAPLARAAFSGFAAAQRAELTAGQTWLRLVAATGLLTLPAGVGMSAVAHPLIALAFGSGWEAAIPVVQVVSLAMCLAVFGVIGQTLFLAHGYMRTSVTITLGALAIRVLLLIVLIPMLGLLGAAWAAAAGIVVEQAMSALYAMRRLHLSLARELLPVVWRCLAATAAMGAVLWFSGLGWRPIGLPWLAPAIVLGAATYLLVLLALWLLRGQPAGPETDLFSLARSMLRRS